MNWNPGSEEPIIGKERTTASLIFGRTVEREGIHHRLGKEKPVKIWIKF